MTEKKETTPGLGDTVLLKLSTQDAEDINRRREDAVHRASRFRAADGTQVHVGNEVKKGTYVPAIVVATFEDGSLNLKAQLDGNDDFWAVGRREGATGGQWKVKG